MIGYLRGRLLRLVPQLALVEVAGVGYEVHVPLATYDELDRRGTDGEVALHIHTHVREDALQLFGFLELRERTLFERLIGVSGIGPRLAQTILSGLPMDTLAAAIRERDLRRLVAIPGVGKKTAERLVLELADRVDDLVRGDAATPGTTPPSDTARDAIEALVGLGYRPAQAERAVAATRVEGEEPSVAELIRAALRRLGGGGASG